MDRSDISKNLHEINNREAPAHILLAITVTYKVVIVSVSCVCVIFLFGRRISELEGLQ